MNSLYRSGQELPILVLVAANILRTEKLNSFGPSYTARKLQVDI